MSYIKLDSVPTESGISVVDPKELQKAVSAHEANRKRALNVSLLATVNDAIARRVRDLNTDRGSREIGARIVVNIDSVFTKETINEVKNQLEAVGYSIKVGHDDGCYDGPGYSTGPSDWFEIYV